MLLLLLLTSCNQPQTDTATPDPLSATIHFSTNDVRIGDVTEVTLTVRHPADSEVETPDLSQEKRVIVRDVERETVRYGSDELLSRIRYDVVSWEVGEHPLSSNDIAMATSDGSQTRIAFPSEPLRIVSSLTEEDTSLRGLKPLAQWRNSVPWWLLVVLAVLMLALVAVWLWRRRESEEAIVDLGPPPKPPHIVALEALRALLEKEYIEKGQTDSYYVELSDVVRQYVENRFHLHAPEQTTEEFIREVSQAHRLSHDHRILLQEFLEQCDLVKFARHRPREGDMRAAFNAAERFVEETKQEMAVHHSGEAA